MRPTRSRRAALPPRLRQHAGAFAVGRGARPDRGQDAAPPSVPSPPADDGIAHAAGSEAMPPVLKQLETLALQELATAHPLPEAIAERCDVLGACIGWDLDSPTP